MPCNIVLGGRGCFWDGQGRMRSRLKPDYWPANCEARSKQGRLVCVFQSWRLTLGRLCSSKVTLGQTSPPPSIPQCAGRLTARRAQALRGTGNLSLQPGERTSGAQWEVLRGQAMPIAKGESCREGLCPHSTCIPPTPIETGFR